MFAEGCGLARWTARVAGRSRNVASPLCRSPAARGEHCPGGACAGRMVLGWTVARTEVFHRRSQGLSGPGIMEAHTRFHHGMNPRALELRQQTAPVRETVAWFIPGGET